MQEVEDAQRIRTTVIYSFDKASLPDLKEEKRKRMLHFVVVLSLLLSFMILLTRI